MRSLLLICALAGLGWLVWKSGIVVPWATHYETPSINGEVNSERKSQKVAIQVLAADSTVNGEPWDGSNSFGGVMGPLFASVGFASPPDLVACIITLNAPSPHCLMMEREGKPSSTCVNARECDWQTEVPKNEDLGLVIFDLDDGWLEGPWDFVDAVYVSEDGDPERLEKLDRLTRAFIENTAPTEIERPNFVAPGPPVPFDTGEKLRREKSFVYLTRDQIAEGFSLTQSTIRVSF